MKMRFVSMSQFKTISRKECTLKLLRLLGQGQFMKIQVTPKQFMLIALIMAATTMQGDGTLDWKALAAGLEVAVFKAAHPSAHGDSMKSCCMRESDWWRRNTWKADRKPSFTSMPARAKWKCSGAMKPHSRRMTKTLDPGRF